MDGVLAQRRSFKYNINNESIQYRFPEHGLGEAPPSTFRLISRLHTYQPLPGPSLKLCSTRPACSRSMSSLLDFSVL